MNLQSIRQDREIEYYAMMSRVVQFTRKNIKNTINVEIPSTISSGNTGAVMLVTTNTEKKIQEEAITA